jgi:S-formylglutathione hydrolase
VTHIERFAIDAVPCTAALPSGFGPWPVCLFLFGGGGNAENLAEIAPLLDGIEMIVACAGVPPFCFYLDRWETLVADALLHAARSRYDADDRAALVGISMGGFGALRIAFERPDVFRAVAVVAPMIEPPDAPLRNRFHYPPEAPRGEQPIVRARRNADAIRRHDLAIAIDAGSRDALNAHDGAEALHRALWDLDLVHEYHLLRDADHVGPLIAPRLQRAFRWAADHLAARPEPDESERALRAHLAPLRAVVDEPTMSRIYGRLDP